MCDGSGFYNDYYVDVDATAGLPCPGCPECQPDLEALYLTPADESEPLWCGMDVWDGKPMRHAGELVIEIMREVA